MKVAALISCLVSSVCLAAPLSIEAQLGQTTQTGSYERSGFVNYGDNQRTTFGDRGSYQDQSSSGIRVGINQPERYRTRYPQRQYPDRPPIRRYGYQTPGYAYGPSVGYTAPAPVVGYTPGAGSGSISQSRVYVDTRPIAPRQSLSPFEKRRLIDQGAYYDPRDLRQYPNSGDRRYHNNHQVPDRYRREANCTNAPSPIYGRDFGDTGRDARGGYDSLPRC